MAVTIATHTDTTLRAYSRSEAAVWLFRQTPSSARIMSRPATAHLLRHNA